ncbi:unnamed protein product [Penicillium salamii]|nr:unnamed protein product [Penicillium salamii]
MTDITRIFQGTEIALPGSATLGFSASIWVIDAKLFEETVDGVHPSCPGSQIPSSWEAKYACHNQEHPHDHGIMRVYCQGPDEGTEFLLPEIRAQQAAPLFEEPEAKAWKKFKEGECQSVPSLLGYGYFTQGQDGPVPGGYITYLVWANVPGEVMTPEQFWSFERPKRGLVRRKFRAAYEGLLSFGYVPGGAGINKVIWDTDSAELRIAGFRWPCRTPLGDKWSDGMLDTYSMIRPPESGRCDDFAKWEW